MVQKDPHVPSQTHSQPSNDHLPDPRAPPTIQPPARPPPPAPPARQAVSAPQSVLGIRIRPRKGHQPADRLIRARDQHLPSLPHHRDAGDGAEEVDRLL
ncbi:hypothetical protein LTR66_014673, partial [Elasticomyces elasticus]